MNRLRCLTESTRAGLSSWLLEGTTVQAGGRRARVLSMSGNSVSIMVNVFSTGLLGYVFWIIAARMLPAEVVGMASGILSAVMLCAQFALLGAGAAVVVLLPGEKGTEERFLSSTMSLMVLTGAASAGLFLALAAGLFEGLSQVSASVWYAAVFVAMVVSWTITLLLHQTFIALRRSDQTVLRNSVVGVVRIGGLVVLIPVAARGDLLALLVVWLTSVAIGLALALRQLRQAYGRFRLRWGMDWTTTRSIVQTGLPNHLVTLATLAPGLVLPIVVTELLSPEMNAYWYALWMIAGAEFIASSSSGSSLFAEIADHPQYLQRDIRQGVRFALLLGVPLAAFVIVFADWILPVLGAKYASEGTVPLRIISLGVLPLAFVEVYINVCRLIRLKEAIIVCILSALASILGGAAGAMVGGLSGIALAWLAVQVVTGVWSMARLRSFSRASIGTDARVAPAPEPDRPLEWHVTRGG